MSKRRRLSRTHRSRSTTRGRMRKLWDRLASLGFRGFTLRWEPIGPALEMCGNSGGYILEERDDEITPLGLSLGEALRAAEHHAEYVKEFAPDRLSSEAA